MEEQIDEKLVKYYAREISLILEHTEEVQRSDKSRYFKEQSKVVAYEEILSLVRGEEDD